MQTKSVYKVPEGKLIKIFLEYATSSNTITSIQIYGDFFAYPEESIQQLEQELRGQQLEKNTLHKVIRSFVVKNNVEFIGINAESLTEAVMRCPR